MFSLLFVILYYSTLYQSLDHFSPFTRGDPVTLPALGRDVTREILFKTVGTLTAHTGFDSKFWLVN